IANSAGYEYKFNSPKICAGWFQDRIEMVCPYCRTEIEPTASTEGITTCEGCNTPHHQECFAENGGCTLFGCKFAPPDEPKVQLNHHEISAAFVSGSSPAVTT